MAEIFTNCGTKVLVSDCDVERVSAHKWWIANCANGQKYAVTSLYLGMREGKKVMRSVRMHRLVMGCVAGDGKIVDHINHDGLDNRRENLRLGGRSMNTLNRRHKKPTHGVQKLKSGCYGARIGYLGGYIHLGSFDTEREAAAAYAGAYTLIEKSKFHEELERLRRELQQRSA